MPRCLHSNVQQFTEICLDCGRNIYESDESYLRYLIQLQEEQRRQKQSEAIERLQQELGIKYTNNESSRSDDDRQYNGYW